MCADDTAGGADPILATLHKVQIHFATFGQLTGVDDLRKLTLHQIRRTREWMAREDQIVRSKHEGKDITCLAWTIGAFWLLPQGVNEYFKAVKESRSIGNGSSIQPTWGLTLREMVIQHVGNLRQLALSLAYDLVTIDALEEKLFRHHVNLKKEFDRCEHVVADLIQDLLMERDRLGELLSDDNVELYERLCMVERMFRTGEATETTLGYTLEDVKQAQQRLEQLCRRQLTVYEQLRERLGEGLRGGERTQLAHTSHLDYGLYQLGELPEGFVGLASLVTFERKRLAALVAAREEELGPSEEGKSLLAQSKELDEARVVARAKPEEPAKPIKKK